jgi:LytR cell envelope-related transcriptional attenuator
MPLHFAFSAGHFVDKVGKIGGFAALVGLAVVVLLWFSQARDLKRLREWAAEEPERMAELEQRMMAQLSRRTAPVPAPQAARPAASGPRPVTPAGARSAAAPFAPPGVAAPALASATRFPDLVPAAAPAPAPVAVPAPVPAVAASAGGGGTTTIAPPVPAATNGRSETATEITPPPAAPAASPPPPPRRSVQIRGRGAAPLRAGGAATASPRKPRDPHGRRWAVLMAAGGVVIIALVALLVTGVLGGGGNGSAKKSSSSESSVTGAPATKTKQAKPKAKPFVRRNTTVSVINGTVATGLAAETEGQLTKAGFGKGVASTGADQSHSATVIYYQAGHKRDAEEVKRVLKGGAIEPIGGKNPVSTVCAVTANSPPPCGSAVDVVVVVGSDRSQ